jgi:hypothetical protein
MKLYRALRSNELSKLNKGLGLVAHCDNCKCKECILDKCCYINDRQHVSSGSKAKIKSRYISATAEESIAAWWCSNSDGNPKYNSKSAKSATYVELDIEYNPIKTIDTCERDYGATANNFARASCEVLIMDDVKMENITNIYRVKQIHKWEYDSLPNAYTKNGLFFKKMCDTIKKTKKYLLSFKIPKNNFNIEIDNFPKDYLLTDSYDTDHEITIDDTIDTDLESMDTESELDSDSQEMYNDSQEMYNDSQEGITDVESDVESIKPRNKTQKKAFKANRQTKKTMDIKQLELGKDVNRYKDTSSFFDENNSMTGKKFGNLKKIRYAGKNTLKQKKGSKKIMHKSTKLTRKRKVYKKKARKQKEKN